MTAVQADQPTRSSGVRWTSVTGGAIAGLSSVWPLLAWVFGFGSFASWYWLQAVPAMLLLAVAGLWLRRHEPHSKTLIALAAGSLGGIAGTVLYDLVRAPFAALGYRLFAPISSYGILMINAPHSTPMTEFLGWTYNFENGIGFGIAYALMALGRRWLWAIPFALFLETATVVTPYSDVYGLRGHLDILAIAYGAHIAYAFGLGWVVHNAGNWSSVTDSVIPCSWALAGTAVVLLLWHQPWQGFGTSAPTDTVFVQGGDFKPEWTYIGQRRCIAVINRDQQSHALPNLSESLAVGGRVELCLSGFGIKRIQIDGRPYSGGFVMIDPPQRW